MSREIKFRAWNDVDKVMIPFSTLTALPKLPVDIMRGRVKHHYLEQYTGLRDKNGVEIYEGDVVDCEDFLDESYLMVVKFDERSRFIAAEKSNDNDFLYLDDLDFFVVGNIHQNPELLEK